MRKNVLVKSILACVSFLSIFCLTGCQLHLSDIPAFIAAFAYGAYNICETYISTHEYTSKSKEYTQEIINLLETERECTLGEVFDDFEWDYAFVIKESYEGGERLAEKLGVDVDIHWTDTDITRRIAFIKGDELAFVHYRTSNEMVIITEGIKVYPSTVLEFSSYYEVGQEKLINADFRGEHEYY